MNTQTIDGPGTAQAEHPGQSIVTITVDGKPVEIHRGAQTAATIKEKAGVPPADPLNQIVDGEIVPLADDKKVTLKGGEIFVSQPNSGGAA